MTGSTITSSIVESEAELIDQAGLAIGLIIGLINGLIIVFFGLGWSIDSSKSVSSPTKSKVFGVELKDDFDIYAFLRHLRRGTFEVRQVMGKGQLSTPYSLVLTVENEVVLEPILSSNLPHQSDTNPTPICKLFHLKSAQVMEEDDEVEIMIDFDDQILSLACDAEDDIIFIAQGFFQVATKLKEDSKFVEELLAGSPSLDTPGKETSLEIITSLATTILSVPVMPLYGILKALESDTNHL